MKYCPKCRADVEGLLYHCDLCGAPLQAPKERFFKCGIYEVPQCLGFSSLCYEIFDAIQPDQPEKYSSFLDEVLVAMVCFPEAMLQDMNIKDRLIYYSRKKYVNMTITVDIDDFVCANMDEKASIVAKAILEGIYLLRDRMRQYKHDIDDIVTQAEVALAKYLGV